MEELKKWKGQALWADMSVTVQYSEGSLVRRVTGPKGHWSEGSLVRRVTSPKCELSIDTNDVIFETIWCPAVGTSTTEYFVQGTVSYVQLRCLSASGLKVLYRSRRFRAPTPCEEWDACQ